MSLNFRTYSGYKDITEMAQVRLGSAEYDRVDPASTLESIPTSIEIENDLQEDNCNPSTDILIVENDNKIIGYSKIGWWTENDGTWLYLHNGYLIPEFRGKGIGTQMLQWSENRIKEISNKHQIKGKGVFGSNATSTEREATQLLLNNHYKKVFSLVEMKFTDFDSIKDSNIPVDFTLKQVIPEHMPLIWSANNAVYANRSFISTPTEEDYQEFINNPNNDLDLWVVAWKGNELAGFVLNEINNGQGEIEEVSVIAKFRRKGLASALVKESILRLKNKGIKTARLHTNGENIVGARSLYEKIGFLHVKDFNRYRKSIV